MFKNSRKISYRRWRRKIQIDGLLSALVNSIETISSQKIFISALKKVVRESNVEMYDIKHLETLSEASYRINNYDSRFAETPKIPFVARFSEGYIIPRYGILLNKNNDILNNVFKPQEETSEILYNRLNRLMIRDPFLFIHTVAPSINTFSNTVTLDEVAPLFPSHTNYYHWLIKTLPKIRYIWWYEEQTGKKVDFLLPPDAPSWMEQTLDLLDVPIENRIYSEEKIYHITNLVVPSWVAHSAEDYTWLKNRILNNISQKEGESTNIFISRSDATDRHITNRGEVKKMLNKYGFEEYVLSELPTKECIRLFNQADVIVGAHGAGLADIIFADNASVIELYGSRYTMTYANIARRLGLQYTKLQCEPVYTDIRVNITDLESAVLEALG